MTLMPKSPHSFILLVLIARLLHKIVRCTMFMPPLKNWSYPELFSFPSLRVLLPKGQLSLRCIAAILVYTSVLDNFNNFHVL